MNALEGRVIVFTGAGAGIGRAVVTRFVQEGARVVAVDIAAERVEQLRDELGSGVEPIAADVRSWDGNVTAVDRAISRFGKLDVFVGNAGITDWARPLDEIDGPDLPSAFQELFAVNVLAPLLGVRAAAKQLIAARGAVILTASYASFHPAGGGVLYTASKHAVLGIVRQLAYEYAPDVRVNGVAPGVAPTQLGGVTALGQQPADSVLPGTREALPLQEIPSADAYAGVFTLLASATESSAMTGTVITADSGLGIRGLARLAGRVRR